MIKKPLLLVAALVAAPWALADKVDNEELTNEFVLPAAQNLTEAESCNPSDSIGGQCIEKSTGVEQNNMSSESKYFIIERTSKYLTEDPVCVSFNNEEDVKDSYCVYTNSKFANGRGVSWFSKSESFKQIITLPAFTNQSLHDDNDQYYVDPPYEIRELPGKGIGLIATRPIKRGEVIFKSLPLLLVETDTQEDLSESDRLKLQTMGANLLPEKSKDLLYGMMGHFGGDRVDDIMNTNMFQVFLGPEETPFTALLPETARMNHACRPNTQYNFDIPTLAHIVQAARDIEVEEELTDSYIDTLQPFKDRQNSLKESWGFTCSCPLCAASTESETLRQESDRRIRQIKRQSQLMKDFINYAPITAEDPIKGMIRRDDIDEEEGKRFIDIPEPEELAALAKSHIRLHELEKLHGRIALAYRQAAFISSALEDRDLALGYGFQALEHMKVWEGPHAEQTLKLEKFVANVEEHWTWGLAKNMLIAEKEVPDR